MQMRPCAHPCITTISNQLPFFDKFARFYDDFIQMGVVGFKTKRVENFNQIPIPPHSTPCSLTPLPRLRSHTQGC